ncbi:MCM OB domain [Trypanosoma vivax]|nr:putative minichromosome maintenance (MCM) complex subunit [Trypanosoma vivax]KAH8606277.1 MCM OB domain [Trypanosoma vivax]
MAICGVAQETVKALWDVHCSCLAPLSYGEEAVGTMWSLFAGFLAPLTLQPVTVSTNRASQLPFSAFTFTVDLRSSSMNTSMRNPIAGEPKIVIPLLEFFKAILCTQQPEKERLVGKVGTWRLYCSVIGDDPCKTPFDSLCASILGRLVTVQGTVVRMSPPRVVCVQMMYRCGSCGSVVTAPTNDGVLVYPGRCSRRCNGYRWSPVLDQSECEEVQMLKIQEQSEMYDGSAGGGSMHKMIVVELRDIWIESAAVGEYVVVCGILCAGRGEGRGSATQQIVVRACSVESGRHNSARVASATFDSLEESGRFYEMARHPEWFSRLCNSLAPSIFGLQHVKEAIVLAVVGGAGIKKRTRSNIHMLMVGDPGLGKSQLLRAACAIAPRSAFVCAHTSSSCGLTLTLTRDPTTGETSFEAGAVVHGDGGITCIDEIDKGAPEHNALLEVMEQESVSMAKAGMVFSVPVRTAILTAGNPIGGRFDDTKSLSANLNLSPALLSRFDIVVCLRNPHADCTRSLSDHVLQLHQHSADGGLNSSPGHSTGILSVDLAQRFIAFCRHHCHPQLSEDACSVLKNHYLERRMETQTSELAVTPRFLQALIRVAEARAKIELRHEVTTEDALYAVMLLQKCRGSLRTDSSSSLPRPGTASRKVSQRDMILNTLKAEVSRIGVNALPHRVVLAACEDAGCRNANAMVHQLNEAGIILQKGDKYQLHGI